ncbi:unnamed protein product [Chrysodeixis includens]|uniref:Uncharacterized protein n=1 Tax=Chrysodeixis includens TaxID=689277 RepID=A0A9N8PXT9_CHRIL|nr:unnamed protein product [Chrysodeixis includens]
MPAAVRGRRPDSRLVNSADKHQTLPAECRGLCGVVTAAGASALCVPAPAQVHTLTISSRYLCICLGSDRDWFLSIEPTSAAIKVKVACDYTYRSFGKHEYYYISAGGRVFWNIYIVGSNTCVVTT